MILRPFAVELAAPLGTAKGEITTRRGTLVGVTRETDAGTVRGVGEATPLPGWTEPLEECRTALAGYADAGSGEALTGLEDRPAARHGVALAVLDAEARAEGVPLAARLAARDDAVADRVPVNATIGAGTPTEAAREAERAARAGYECLKVKAGVGALSLDVERVRAVREAVGDGVTLRVDANGAWTPDAATSAIESLAALGVSYVEQPLPADDLAGMAALRGRGVGVAADEALAEYDIDTVLDADAADVIVVKPMVLGGPDRAREAARRARRAGVGVTVTTTVDAVVARTGAVHVAASLPEVRPCGVATGDLLADDLAPDPAPVADGAVDRPAGPGLAGEAFDGLLW